MCYPGKGLKTDIKQKVQTSTKSATEYVFEFTPLLGFMGLPSCFVE